MEQNKALDPIDIALLGANAVVFAAQHAAHQVKELGFGCGLLHRLRLAVGIHANRVFPTAFSVPSTLNGLIGLKDDTAPRRIGVFDAVFRRSTSS